MIDVTLIEAYLERHRWGKSENLVSVLETFKRWCPEADIALIFGHPGIAVDGAPVCCCRLKKGNVFLTFFRRDILEVYFKELAAYAPSGSSLTVQDVTKFAKSEAAQRMVRAMVSAVKVDAQFQRQIAENDWIF